MISRLALAAALAFVASPTVAAEADMTAAGAAAAQSTPGSAQDAHHAHDDDDEGEVVVTGIRRRAQDVLGGISVLDAADLTREVAPEHRRNSGAPAGRQLDQLRASSIRSRSARPYRATASAC